MMIGGPTDYLLVGVLGYAVPVGVVAFFVYWVVRKAVRDGMRDAAAGRLPTAPQDTPEPPHE
ncbi:hypothetical protein [Cellulomonas cellasea]|uniref:Heme exporter protein D n=1 Tax=Cellulomonas cellasea TaxID=43670 RepID=A0A7W4UIV9_9CELL|nr:hypothetical protein [Cellulomonas cellasea]MBB2924988.1 hypothetical protein [Cellulomonas cellasea]